MLNEEKHLDIEKLAEEVLKTPPDISLPENFADFVAKKATRRFALEEYIKEFLIYTAVIVGLVGTTFSIIYFWMESSWVKLFQIVSANLIPLIGITFLLLFILFADKVLLRYCFYRYSDKD